MSFHTGEQSSLSFPNYANESLNKGDNADAGQSIICHVERSEPLGRWPKGKANISQMSHASTQRGILRSGSG